VQYAKQLADDLREKIKALGYDRHKLVVQVRWSRQNKFHCSCSFWIVLMHGLSLQVTLGQKKGQAMRVVSRCLWDTHSDSSASELYENETLYCVCQVSQADTFHKHKLILTPTSCSCIESVHTLLNWHNRSDRHN